MKWKPLWIVIALGALMLSACELNDNQTETPSSEEILTQVVETVHASLSQTPAASNTPAPTATILLTATATPTPPPTASPPPTQPGGSNAGGGGGGNACDLAVFISDVTIPDGTQLAPGAAFTKTWRLRNGGTCPWTPEYRLIFISGEQMSGVSPQQFTTETISPGATVDISVDLVAPLTAGTYTGYWKLQNAQGAPFETSFYVQIAVVGDATTTATPTVTPTGGTATPTSTPTGAVTSTSTPTSAVTATDTPNPTPTETPLPTDTPVPSATPVPSNTPQTTPEG